MMRRVDLLPARYRAKRQERKIIFAMSLGAFVLAALLGLWWFMLGASVDSEREALAAAQARNATLQSQINELQEFAQLETEVQAKRSALQTVMAGDIGWPSVLTEIAMVIPGEVWIDSLSASAGQTEGATSVGTETAAVRVSDQTPTGRISFQGQSTSMPGVARWLVRLGTVDAFSAVWLNSATGPEPGSTATQELFQFDSTLELGSEALSQRYQGDLP